MKKLTKQGRMKSGGRTSPRSRLPVLDAEEQILREATKHLIRQHGGLFVATGIREEPGAAPRAWIITVTLRYPTGDEGYVGDLRYDGRTFTFLTEQSLIDERVRQIAGEHARLSGTCNDTRSPSGETACRIPIRREETRNGTKKDE
jgi:hypothetical protein